MNFVLEFCSAHEMLMISLQSASHHFEVILITWCC